MLFHAIIYTFKILSENFMLRKPKHPFVRDSVFNRKKSEFIPCPILSRDPDRQFIPMWVEEIKGEVDEQYSTVSNRKES